MGTLHSDNEFGYREMRVKQEGVMSLPCSRYDPEVQSSEPDPIQLRRRKASCSHCGTQVEKGAHIVAVALTVGRAAQDAPQLAIRRRCPTTC